MKMKMKRNFLLIIAASLLLAGCSKNNSLEEENNSDEKAVTTVKTEKVSKTTLFETITTNGNVRAEASLEVYSVVSGRVVKNELFLGKQVKKGDVLAVIDPSVTGGRYSLHEVISPISGTVLVNPVQTGSIISTETRLTVIGDLSKLQISAFIPERFYGQLKTGQKADLSVEAYPDQVFSAKIKSISPVIDENSRTCEVLLSLEKDSKIVAGMFADVKLYLKAYENVISIPSNCISERSGEKIVYAIQTENSVKLVKIQTAQTLKNRTIVVSGLSEEDEVITEGFETLVEGAVVNIISEK